MPDLSAAGLPQGSDGRVFYFAQATVATAENPLDKQIAAMALIHDLEVISRNGAHYAPTGVRVKNTFT